MAEILEFRRTIDIAAESRHELEIRERIEEEYPDAEYIAGDIVAALPPIADGDLCIVAALGCVMARLIAMRQSRDEDAGEIHTKLQDATLAFWCHYRGIIEFDEKNRIRADEMRAALVGFAKEDER